MICIKSTKTLFFFLNKFYYLFRFIVDFSIQPIINETFYNETCTVRADGRSIYYYFNTTHLCGRLKKRRKIKTKRQPTTMTAIVLFCLDDQSIIIKKKEKKNEINCCPEKLSE